MMDFWVELKGYIQHKDLIYVIFYLKLIKIYSTRSKFNKYCGIILCPVKIFNKC